MGPSAWITATREQSSRENGKALFGALVFIPWELWLLGIDIKRRGLARGHDRGDVVVRIVAGRRRGAVRIEGPEVLAVWDSVAVCVGVVRVCPNRPFLKIRQA